MESGGKLRVVPRDRVKTVWDCHVHCYPSEVIEDPEGWARRHHESHWRRLVTEGPQGWATADELLQAMDRDGVERVLLQSWYWEHPDSAQRQNDWHAEWISRYPDRFMACMAWHPELGDPEQALKEAAAWGAVAVGECLPQIQSANGWHHPAWKLLFDWTCEQGWPVTLHVTEPVGHEYPGRLETSLMGIIGIFEAYPRQKWICAHWGGGLPFYSLNRRVRKALGNVWFESSASPLLYHSRIWKTVVELVGADKVLFGSDFPLLNYPRREKSPGWGLLLEEFEGSGLGLNEQLAIAAENLKGLLGIPK